MRLLLLISLCFFSCKSDEGSTRLPAENTLPVDTLRSPQKFHPLANGLYINATGDIGIKTFKRIGDDTSETMLETYITRVHTGKNEKDGGPQYLENVVDTATFQTLADGYFKDKANVYFLAPSSGGGTLRVIHKADPPTFRALGDRELAMDRAAYYQHGEKITKQKYLQSISDTADRK